MDVLTFLLVFILAFAGLIFASWLFPETLFPIILLGLYFLPTIVAISRDHINALAIFLTNLFFGWTIFGWIFALIWSVLK